MEQDDEQHDSGEQPSADYWSRKFAPLRAYSSMLSDFALDLYEAGKITRDESTEVFRAFNEVIARGGSTGRADDAISYALYRDGLHQMRQRLLGLRPELRAEIESQLPEIPGPAR